MAQCAYWARTPQSIFLPAKIRCSYHSVPIANYLSNSSDSLNIDEFLRIVGNVRSYWEMLVSEMIKPTLSPRVIERKLLDSKCRIIFSIIRLHTAPTSFCYLHRMMMSGMSYWGQTIDTIDCGGGLCFVLGVDKGYNWPRTAGTHVVIVIVRH